MRLAICFCGATLFAGIQLACSGTAPMLGSRADSGASSEAQAGPPTSAGTDGGEHDTGVTDTQDSSDAVESGAICPSGHLCGSACVPESPSSCGPSCVACSAPSNATSTCQSGACGFQCNAGYAACGGSCCTPYTHTITIDGNNDFTGATEQFTTTSASYSAYVTWDDANLYLGYDGSDIAVGAAGGQTFLFAYFDVDPGSGTGATIGAEYGTQRPMFPGGFGADVELAWNPGTSGLTLSAYQQTSWVPLSATQVNLERGASTFVEMSVSLANLGIKPGGKFGLVTLMMYTQASAEWSYAGLWSESFTDGYYAMVPLTYSLSGDLSSAAPPNALSNRSL